MTRPKAFHPLPLTLVLCFFIAFVSSGCSEATKTEGCPATPPGGVSPDDYCSEFAEILCRGYDDCCGLPDVDGCIERIFDECEAGEISSIQAGQACLDGTVARQCLDAYRQAFEDCEYNDSLDDACRYQWYGLNTVGEPCRDIWWCERGLGCQLEGTAGVCVELPGLDEYCGDTAVCRPGGYYCSYEDWTCHARPVLGEPCEREDVENLCAVGVCFEGICQSTSWCG